MNRQEKIKKIKSLSYQEVGVLFYKKSFENDADVLEKLAISQTSMYNLQRTAFDKLEIPAFTGEEWKRWPYFLKNFWDAFSFLIPDEKALIEWPTKNMKEEEPSTNTLPDTSTKQEAPCAEQIVIPSPPNNQRKWLQAFLACAILGVIAIVIIWGLYLLLREIPKAKLGSPIHIPPIPTIIVPHSNLTPSIQNNQQPTNTLTLTSNQSPISTLPSTSTSTPLPTSTLVPTSTYSPLPTNTILSTVMLIPTATEFSANFEDNFNNGVSPVWVSSGGSWETINGRLTLAPDDTDYHWLSIYAPNWNNYRIIAIVNRPGGGIAISVRDQPSSKLAYIFDVGGWYCWANYDSENNGFNCITEKISNNPNQINLQIDVNKNTYIAYINGIEQQTLSIIDREKGGVSVGISCGYNQRETYLVCPDIDDFKVEPIP